MSQRTLTDPELCLFYQAWRLKHNITNEAFEEFIKFHSFVTQKLDGPLSSLYKFDKYFEGLAPREQVEMLIFCPACYTSYQEAQLPNSCHCGETLSTKLRKAGYFSVYSPIKQSIRHFLEVGNCYIKTEFRIKY